MSRRPLNALITVAFSTRGALMPAWMSQHLAADAGLSALDQDASSAVAAWLVSRTGHRDAYVPTASLWLPIGMASSERSRRLVRQVSERQGDEMPSLVLLASSLQYRDLGRQVVELQGTAATRLLIGVNTSQLRGGRPHLVQLGALRHFAEEWDLGVALDQTGHLDPTWEPEAAVTRLGQRLQLLRVRDTSPSRTAVGLDRVACRALHAALDRESPLVVAVASSRISPLPATPRVVAVNVRRAADYIIERSMLHISALREDLDHFEQSRSSRGA
ncbi:MAG: hypothetical protein KC442_25915 [Thermomicrobiales bacterium]|nr:hypothetical protein [Thermomicrobiales bacterium]